jgi:hypothetical protein
MIVLIGPLAYQIAEVTALVLALAVAVAVSVRTDAWKSTAIRSTKQQGEYHHV